MKGLARGRPWCLVGAVALGALGCDGGTTKTMGSHTPFAGCLAKPTAPPAGLGLVPFYVKYLDGHGTPVVSSERVSDEALLRACRITGNMVSLREDVRQAMAGNNHRVAVLAMTERVTDLPENEDLYTAFPNTDWNTYRAVSATRVRPVTSISEENLLCLSGDMYPGDSALVHVLAHSMRDLGILEVDPQFGSQLQTAYASAMAQGLWANTSATKDADAYWAVGGLAWFGVGARLPVKSRADLADYDAPLAALLAAYLPLNDWHPSCYP
ncbi:MAG: hypothetical protein JXP73_21925 [Deltaproteobacteria bacterium]|nr:hypothetical protein [Deltaproteobacteria bacterium]